MTNFKIVKKAIEEVMGESLLKEITSDSNLEELGCNSLNIVEIVMEIEDEFFLEIPDADLKAFKSIQDLLNYTENKKETK